MVKLEDTPERIKRRAYEKAYREANKEKISEKGKRCYKKNKEKILSRQREYNKSNRDEILKRAKDYYEANKEKIDQRNKEYAQANKEAAKIRRRRHYLANKEKAREQAKAWRKANPDKVAKYSDKYRRANLEKKATASKNYRKKNPAITSWRDATKRAWKGGKTTLEVIGLSADQAKEVWRNKMEIAKKYFPKAKMEHDHINPIADALTNEDQIKRNHFTNFVFIPMSENRKKYSKPFWEWYAGLKNEKLKKCIAEQDAYNKNFQNSLSK